MKAHDGWHKDDGWHKGGFDGLVVVGMVRFGKQA